MTVDGPLTAVENLSAPLRALGAQFISCIKSSAQRGSANENPTAARHPSGNFPGNFHVVIEVTAAICKKKMYGSHQRHPFENAFAAKQQGLEVTQKKVVSAYHGTGRLRPGLNACRVKKMPETTRNEEAELSCSTFVVAFGKKWRYELISKAFH